MYGLHGCMLVMSREMSVLLEYCFSLLAVLNTVPCINCFFGIFSSFFFCVLQHRWLRCRVVQSVTAACLRVQYLTVFISKTEQFVVRVSRNRCCNEVLKIPFNDFTSILC